jgi:dTDP-D-glucose 4,6-dehydratase
VRRILDERPHIIVPDAGLSLSHFGYVENLAHAVMLAVDQPDKAKGQIYNCGDQQVLTLRQVVDTIARSLGHEWEVVSMPWELAIPARPMVAQPWTNHRIVSTGKIEAELGYRDVVAPIEALSTTARWLAANRPEPGGIEEIVLEDPFDYAAEDLLIERYREALAKVAMPEWRDGSEPGYGLAYSGPGARPRTQPTFT